ncbi:type II toxin-antitoxin system Phd/YefM family antitoxin [Pelodictyon phaeoclathratiforme]|jgi:antitoxin (DNA-binding transcriptional repressor) of toxin-antitoxin stability system|uniref:Prevent-host-death family protein n=1 Tax=Pelodictyon phaeoclathratiforme (strain DSM 5477 / BU-1) TaxID=324925 RepID=B4SEF5_PELPB|nr:prevent-host-death protein [Pelodictyon phaeoclathratiforme]ACF43047.1 prevent-host-death family protein [Pelodictyon phaeoclathratiforme BU-1]MBV5289209.1 prevent-host-death protein [Pelodictyon phaeoclathratiforme]
MKTLPVGEVKAQLSEILEKVKQGESFGILYGKKKRPIAMIVPYLDSEKKKERKIGILDGKVKITFADNFKMTEEEFLGLK